MNKEKNFQTQFIKELEQRDLKVIQLSDLIHPNGKPDLLILRGVKYFYAELKQSDHKKDFMLKSLFAGRPQQLSYYYEFLTSPEWKLYVIVKMNRGYEVISMTRKIVKAILAGLKYSQLATEYFTESNFFTNRTELINYIKEVTEE